MGLDILAASHLRFLRPIPDDDELDRLEDDLAARNLYLSDVYFIIEPNLPEWRNHLAGREPGLYDYSPASEQHDFRAGSYSYYNEWRELLCRFALGVEPKTVWDNLARFAGGPFVELIHFTDCDGCIGPRVAAKLLADFRTHAARAEQFATLLPDDIDFLGNYRDFTRAFELAAQDGALRFC